MDFSEALRAVKDGARIARTGWNGKGMWVALSPGFKGLPADKIWAAPIREHADEHGHAADFRPYLMMLTAQGDFVPWVISQTDALADDWERA